MRHDAHLASPAHAPLPSLQAINASLRSKEVHAVYQFLIGYVKSADTVRDIRENVDRHHHFREIAAQHAAVTERQDREAKRREMTEAYQSTLTDIADIEAEIATLSSHLKSEFAALASMSDECGRALKEATIAETFANKIDRANDETEKIRNEMERVIQRSNPDDISVDDSVIQALLAYDDIDDDAAGARASDDDSQLVEAVNSLAQQHRRTLLAPQLLVSLAHHAKSLTDTLFDEPPPLPSSSMTLSSLEADLLDLRAHSINVSIQAEQHDRATTECKAEIERLLVSRAKESATAKLKLELECQDAAIAAQIETINQFIAHCQKCNTEPQRVDERRSIADTEGIIQQLDCEIADRCETLRTLTRHCAWMEEKWPSYVDELNEGSNRLRTQINEMNEAAKLIEGGMLAKWKHHQMTANEPTTSELRSGGLSGSLLRSLTGDATSNSSWTVLWRMYSNHLHHLRDMERADEFERRLSVATNNRTIEQLSAEAQSLIEARSIHLKNEDQLTAQWRSIISRSESLCRDCDEARKLLASIDLQCLCPWLRVDGRTMGEWQHRLKELEHAINNVG